MTKMKQFAILFAAIIALTLAACGGDPTPEPTVMPTAEPTLEEATETPTEAPTEAQPEPTAEPTEVTEEVTEVAVEDEQANLTALTAHPWEWTAFSSPVEQFEVEKPESYIAIFNTDGTINLVADCNNASGSYTADASSLTIEIGPMTMAACPEDSRSDQFVQLLSAAAIYFFADDSLYIDLMADGGTMRFEPAESQASDELAMDNAFLTNSWEWVLFTNPAEQFDIDMPQSYVLTFYEDGSVTIIADCNNVLGDYSTDAGSLSIALGPATLADCSPESRSDQFTQYLSSAAIYYFEDGNLYVDLMADGGTMVFAPVDLEGLVDEDAIISSVPADLVTQLDTFLQSQVYTDSGDPNLAAPGLVLYVETPDGRYLNSAGVANLEDGSLVQVDDILEIGSNTKSMTVVLLMQLVEEGLLSLDDTLSQYLPDQAAILPNGDQITIRQMAQHTAGLYDYADNIMAAGIADSNALEAGFAPVELVQDAAVNGSPYFAPGEQGQWHYSNTGYVLLGMIIESITGEAAADLYQTRIFDPLGMESAIFLEGVPQPGDIDTHGYWWTDDGEIVDTTNWNGSQGWVAGAAAMTAEDLATYAKALAAGELFQNPETLNEMLVFDEAATFKVGGPYGLGLIDFAGDGTVWGHGGQTLGFQSLWFIQPETGNVVVGLTNSASYSADAFLNVLNILEGKGAQPLGPTTLTPAGNLIGTSWAWAQFVNPVEAVDIDETAGLNITISKSGSVAVSSAECGEAFGTYTSAGIGNISFELDDSSWTCADDSPAGQFVDYLSQATSWSFNNGNLIIELPADGGTMIFEPPS